MIDLSNCSWYVFRFTEEDIQFDQPNRLRDEIVKAALEHPQEYKDILLVSYKDEDWQIHYCFPNIPKVLCLSDIAKRWSDKMVADDRKFTDYSKLGLIFGDRILFNKLISSTL